MVNNLTRHSRNNSSWCSRSKECIWKMSKHTTSKTSTIQSSRLQSQLLTSLKRRTKRKTVKMPCLKVRYSPRHDHPDPDACVRYLSRTKSKTMDKTKTWFKCKTLYECKQLWKTECLQKHLVVKISWIPPRKVRWKSSNPTTTPRTRVSTETVNRFPGVSTSNQVITKWLSHCKLRNCIEHRIKLKCTNSKVIMRCAIKATKRIVPTDSLLSECQEK